MELIRNGITLRDYRESDADDEIYWMTEETCWLEADTPWLTVDGNINGEELRKEMNERYLNIPENVVRWRLELEKDNKHIGFVSSYFMSEDFSEIDWENIDEKKSLKENNLVRALGIEICDEDYWNKKVGRQALVMFMDYFRGKGEEEFVLETWSGNIRMIKCAKSVGFVEVKRIKGKFDVYGEKFDSIIMKYVEQ